MAGALHTADAAGIRETVPMDSTERRWSEAAPIGMTPIEAFRETITRTAALGFSAGALVRLALGGTTDPHGAIVDALYLPLGAVAAAVLAGILVNVIALPALCRVVPGRRLPDSAYRAAGALSGLAAFAGALAVFPPGAA